MSKQNRAFTLLEKAANSRLRQGFGGQACRRNDKGIFFFSLTGFTIIEMLVVVSVIALLASILLPTLNSAQRRAKEMKTEAMIESITVALKQYRTDFGAYPPENGIPGEVGVTAAECVYYYTAATFTAGVNSEDKSAGPYMEYRTKDKQTTGRDTEMDGNIINGPEDLYEVIDVWGNPLRYDASSPPNNPASFDIYSYGPDETDDTGGDDDINNWD